MLPPRRRTMTLVRAVSEPPPDTPSGSVVVLLEFRRLRRAASSTTAAPLEALLDFGGSKPNWPCAGRWESDKFFVQYPWLGEYSYTNTKDIIVLIAFAPKYIMRRSCRAVVAQLSRSCRAVVAQLSRSILRPVSEGGGCAARLRRKRGPPCAAWCVGLLRRSPQSAVRSPQEFRSEGESVVTCN